MAASDSAHLQKEIESLTNDFQKVAALELQFYMRNQLLRDADVFSMASSVELRVPFLDTQLMEAALAISPELSLRWWQREADYLADSWRIGGRG